MSYDTQVIKSYFFKLGISSEIADIYLALLAFGPQSISDLARNSGVERTRIYRLMEEMTSSSLIQVEVEYKKSIFRAAPIENLQILIAKKEQEVLDLRQQFSDMHQALTEHSVHESGTRIMHYRGNDGVRQMYWNQTKSKSEGLSILYENMQIRTGLSFFERWVRRCNERNMKFRSIIGDNFVKTQKDWYIEAGHTNERLVEWQGRYLPDEIFSISHSVVIYDNVTAYYNWKGGEVFGIEIYNQDIADSQRRLFELLWSQAVPIDDLKGPEKEK